MKFTRTLVLIIGATLFFTACSKEADEVITVAKENTNPLLAYVPADTAYVIADIESVPKEITDAYVSRFQPALDVMSAQISQFQANYAAGEFQNDNMAKFATAVLDELGGSLSPESLEKFGISLQAHHVFYAKGIFPVARVELTDAQELRHAIARLETTMGFELPRKELNGNQYWRIAEGNLPFGMYIAILDRQLAVSVFPISAEDSYLAAFLGQEMPATSFATTNALATMNSKKGYSNFASGIVDFQKLSDEIFNADSDTRTFLGADMTSKLASLDEVCVAEIKSIIAKAPRMTAGTTRMTANEIAMQYDLEIESTLASGLAALVSDTPAASDSDYLLSASLALQVGKLRNFVLEKVTALVASPYQCAVLQEMNQSAGELVTQLNIPMPPMINNLMGARVRIDDFNPMTDIRNGNGLLALHVDKPEMFVGMASMFVPGFDALDLANQTEPVRIPDDVLQMQGLDVFALMSNQAIGVSVGEQNASDLAGFMAHTPGNNNTFFSVSMDMAKQVEIEAALAEKMQMGMDDKSARAREFSRAVRQSYTDMLGRTRIDMRFTADGLVIDNEMTFK